MESPKTGIVLLMLVAFTTASGAFLGWTMRPKPAPVEVVRPAAELSVGVAGTTIETPAPAGTNTEKRLLSGQ